MTITPKWRREVARRLTEPVQGRTPSASQCNRARFPRSRGAREIPAHDGMNHGRGEASDLTRAYAEQPWDVIVADGLSIGAHFASELTATPWVTVSIVPLTIPSRDLPPPILGLSPATGFVGRLCDSALRAVSRAATRGIRRAYSEERERAGLPASDLPLDQAFIFPELVCASGRRTRRARAGHPARRRRRRPRQARDRRPRRVGRSRGEPAHRASAPACDPPRMAAREC